MIRYLGIIFLLSLTIKSHSEDCRIKVLGYSSLLGKGSLGEWVQAEWNKRAHECSVEFISAKEFSGIWGTLKKSIQKKDKNIIDVVWGISDLQYQEAEKLGWLKDGQLFDFSPFSIVVDKNKFKDADKIISWNDLAKVFKNELIIQDPRMSNTGLGWLRAIYEFNLLKPEFNTQIVKKVFPSWSSSYEAFLSGLGAGVWTYLSSVAYHRCEEKKENYVALNLIEGYPVQREFVALSKNTLFERNAKNFMNFLLSAQVQEKIPTLNWMFPGSQSARVKMPQCFVDSSNYKTIESKTFPTMKLLEEWAERWSLL
ncbi:MAG: thiamine ABC transporter substrate-binding protein [Proteobacteria bacterium]|nr:thiamine ABC transporter substrate-binding protein [Pseudomonadota bacterium]